MKFFPLIFVISLAEVIFKIDGDVVTFSGTGKCTSIDQLNDRWSFDIREVIMENNITDVGKRYFMNCTKLVKVSLSDSIRILQNSCFYGCTMLSDINFPRNLQDIGNYVFYNCSNLVYLNITCRDLGLSWFCFSFCTKLSSIGIFVEESFSCDYGSFLNSSIKNLTVKCFSYDGYFNPNNEEIFHIFEHFSIECRQLHMFYDNYLPSKNVRINCTGLLIFEIQCFKLAKKVSIEGQDVQLMGRRNYIEVPLEVLSITAKRVYFGYYIFSQLNVIQSKNVNLICDIIVFNDYAFANTSRLTNLDLSDISYNLYIPGYCFANCSNLESITLNRSTYHIGDHAFLNCYSLKTIDFGTNISRILSCAFENCTSLQVLELNSENYSIESKAFCGCTKLEEVSLNGGLKKISEDAFTNSTIRKLSMYAPTLDYKLDNHNFNNCQIEILTLYFRAITFKEQSFQNISSLKTVNLSYEQITIGKGSFNNCQNLDRIVINGVEHYKAIDCFTFNCSYPESFNGIGLIAIYNINLDSIGNELENFTKLENVSFISENIRSLDNCFNSPNLHTVFFQAYQVRPVQYVFEIPSTVLRVSNVIRGSKMRKIVINRERSTSRHFKYTNIITDCDTLESIEIKKFSGIIENLAQDIPNLKEIRLPLMIEEIITNIATNYNTELEIYYCGPDKEFLLHDQMFPIKPKYIYVSELYKNATLGGYNVTRIRVEECVQNSEDENKIIRFKTQVIEKTRNVEDILPIFLFNSISSSYLQQLGQHS